MADSVFLDTSYLLALELTNDQYHDVASQHWKQVSKALPRLVTTSYIFDEVATFFNSRGLHAKALSVGNMLLRSPSLHFIHVDPALFFDGWAYFQKHEDKMYSLTDCISFVVMEHLRITTAFTFDQHFVRAGFTRIS